MKIYPRPKNEVVNTTEIEDKMPWESKTELIAFVGIVAGLIYSFGLIPAELTAEQVSGIGTVLFTLIAIARKYGGGRIVLSK